MVCPNCGRKSVYYRKTRHLSWRCQRCGHEWNAAVEKWNELAWEYFEEEKQEKQEPKARRCTTCEYGSLCLAWVLIALFGINHFVQIIPFGTIAWLIIGIPSSILMGVLNVKGSISIDKGFESYTSHKCSLLEPIGRGVWAEIIFYGVLTGLFITAFLYFIWWVITLIFQ